MSENYEFDTRMTGKVMQFTDGESGDTSHEAYTEVQFVENNEGFIELAFDTKNPKRRNYLRIRVADLRRALRASP